MGTYILILYIYTGPGIATIAPEFNTAFACEEAGKEIENHMSKLVGTIKYICVSKGENK